MAINTSLLPSLRRSFPSEAGYTPVFLETDGSSLILRGGVTMNGKRYDIQIEMWDAQDKRIHIGEDTPFSESSLREIQKIVAEKIFGALNDQIQIWYQADSNACLAKDFRQPEEAPAIDLSGEADLQGVVEGAREIYQLLAPGRSVEVALNENASLITYPRRITPPSSSQKREPPSPGSTPLTFSRKVPAPPRAPLVDEEKINELDKKFTNQKKRSTFLKDVTYAGLCAYARNPSGTDTLYPPIYAALKKLLASENSVDQEEEKRMKEVEAWICGLCHSAYQEYKRYKDYFNSLPPRERQGTIEETCKYYAVAAVLGFIKVEKTNIDDYLEKLISAL